MKSKKFDVTEKQLDEVAKVIGTGHFMLFSHDPEKVSDSVISGPFSARRLPRVKMYGVLVSAIRNLENQAPEVRQEYYSNYPVDKSTSVSLRPSSKPRKVQSKKK